MKIFGHSSKFSFRSRISVLVIGMILAVVSLVYTNKLANVLKQKEQHDVELWVAAMERVSREYFGDYMTDPLISHIVSTQNNIPFIITDQDLNLVSYNRIPEDVIKDPEKFRRKLNELTEENTPRTVRMMWMSNRSHIIFYGKSSLLRAGVFPRLRYEDFLPVYIRLEHNTDETYLAQITRKVEEAAAQWKVGIEKPSNDAPGNLWDLLRSYALKEQQTGIPKSVVLVFDQFEEIFTLQQDIQRKRQFFEEMADLLNDIMPRSIAGISGNGNTCPAGFPAGGAELFAPQPANAANKSN